MARKKMLPIGVDLGGSSVKLVQLRQSVGLPELIAYGAVQIPPHIRDDETSQIAHLGRHIPALLKSNGFKGKKCVLGLSTANAFVRHVRVPRRDQAGTITAVRRAVQVELPYPASEAVIRHVVAGEVYEDGEVRQEVIVVAVPNETLDAYLEMLTRVGLEVVGVGVEPIAMLQCYRASLQDPAKSVVFIDMGATSVQVTIARGEALAFSRTLQGGAEHLNRAIAQALESTPDEISQMRQRMQQGEDLGQMAPEICRWQDLWLDGLCADIDNCLRYYESVFRGTELDRLVFTGEQASDTRLCQTLSRRMSLPGQVGDPLASLHPKSPTPGEVGADVPATALAVGMGLSLSGSDA